MTGAPLLLWLGLSGLAGLWFLLRAIMIRWRGDQAGYRMALFAAGFGLIGLTMTTPDEGTWPGLVARVVGVSAELFVGLSALRATRR